MPSRHWQPGGDAEAAAGARAGREVAAEQRGALPHADYPVAGPVRGAAAPAVGDLDRQLAVLLVDGDLAVVRAGVADHVGDGFLDDAERRQVDVSRERLPDAAPVHVDRHARVQRDGGQPFDVGKTRGRVQWRMRRRGFRLGASQPGHHSPQSGQGFPAGGLDGGQGVACLGGTGVENPVASAGLDRDDADAVRHDVVQFAGDPQPLRHYGLGGRLGAHQFGPGLRLPDRVSDKPGNDGDEDHGRDHAASPEPDQVESSPARAQHDGTDHDRAGNRDPGRACRRDVADLNARRSCQYGLKSAQRRQFHLRDDHPSAECHYQRGQRPAAQQQSGSQQDAADRGDYPHNLGALNPPVMLMAAIVAAWRCLLVCPRIYASGQTRPTPRWFRGQTRRARGMRHLFTMDALIDICGVTKRYEGTAGRPSRMPASRSRGASPSR